MSDETRNPQTDRARAYLQAFFDGQLEDPALKKEIERKLKSDPAFAREYRELSAMRERIKSMAKAKAPAYLRNRVTLALKEAAAERDEARGNRRPAWLGLWRQAGWAAAAALLLVVGLNVVTDRGPDRSRFEVPATVLNSFVEEHLTVLQSGQSELVTQDRRELAGWFKERLDFAPSVPGWSWAELVSGQVIYNDGRRVAHVQYRIAGDVVSLFIGSLLPPGKMEAAGATSPGKAIIDTLRGYKIACWGRQGLDYVMVADASSSELFEYLSIEG